MSVRWLVWVVVNLALMAACVAYSDVAHTFDANGISRVILGTVMGGLGLLSVFTFPDVSGRKKLTLLLAVALLPRIALLPAAPSDDVNRYLWEGKLTVHGVNPYQGVADDPAFAGERDSYWEAMNHRERPTAYPPLAMQVFRAINMLGYHPMSYKVAFLLLDMLLIAALLALLRHHGLPLHWVLFYALSPLSLLSFAAEGHFDIVMVLALVVALLAHSKQWWVLCGTAAGIAVGSKIVAAVVVPMLLWKSGWRGWLAAFVSFTLPLAFYWQDITSVVHALFVFGSGGRFNGPVHQLLSWAFSNNYGAASLSVAILYTGLWLGVFWLMLKGRLWSSVLIALGGLLLLSPIVHFWYLTWLLPLVALRPKLSWVSLSLTFSLYFLVWHHQELGLGWTMPLWARWGFWLPFFVLFVAENRNMVTRLKHLVTGKRRGVPEFSIVIPTYQPGASLQRAIDSLAAQDDRPSEVILADAGSQGSVLDGLEMGGLDVRSVESELGRGKQITAGVQHATAEWVVVMHADVVLPDKALSKLRHALEMNPGWVGGSLGQRFARRSPGLLLVEAMNEFRATLMHTSFGDQTQFFHRSTALRAGVLTDQPLMEDVEMSDRLNAVGHTGYVAVEGEVSARKWTGGSYWQRFFTVIEFCFRYRLCAFTRQQRQALSEKFYTRYYKPQETE